MSLTVDLPPNTQGLQRSLQLRLPRYKNRDNRDDNTISIQCSRSIHSDDRYHISEGSMLSGAASPVRLVCKLSYTDEGMDHLAQEDSIYRALKSLQGKVVPQSYGYFEDLKVAGCLVLEHAGEPLQRPFEYIPRELKIKVMDAFNQIHKAGVTHGDVAERNVLVDKEGRVSVIDFEEALRLECDRALPIPGLGDFGPDKDDFNCDELWELGWAMRMWKPSTIGLYGLKTPLEAFNDPQKLIAQRPPYYSARRAEREAYDMLMSYLQEWIPEAYAQIPQDGHRHWPAISIEDREVDEDLGIDMDSSSSDSEDSGPIEPPRPSSPSQKSPSS